MWDHITPQTLIQADLPKYKTNIAHIASDLPRRALCGAHIHNTPTISAGRCIVCADLARRGHISR